jgi:hypothetical protein
MSNKLIIISRYGNETYINKIKSYNLVPEVDTVVIYPTDTVYETTLILPELTGYTNYIIIYDWSVSLESSPSTSISNILSSSVIVDNGYDIVYLGKYLDTCSKYNLNSNIDNFSLVTGSDPIGFNSIVISSSYAAKLTTELQNSTYFSISYAIANLNVVAESPYIVYAVSPNLFVYNPLYNSIDLSKSYSAKTTECQSDNSQIIPGSDNNLVIFWIIIIIIGICLILWLLLNYTTFGINTKYFNDTYLENKS